MTEKEIKFADIREGDTIQTKYTHQDLEVSFVGIATTKDPYTGNWLTASGQDLTQKSRPQTYILLNRPKPKLPTEPESIIWTTRIIDHNDPLKGYLDLEKYAILDGEGDWVIVFPDGVEYFRPEHIVTWYPVAVNIIKEEV